MKLICCQCGKELDVHSKTDPPLDYIDEGVRWRFCTVGHMNVWVIRKAAERSREESF